MRTVHSIAKLTYKDRQLGFDRLLDVLGIACHQLIFGTENALSPICRLLGRV